MRCAGFTVFTALDVVVGVMPLALFESEKEDGAALVTESCLLRAAGSMSGMMDCYQPFAQVDWPDVGYPRRAYTSPSPVCYGCVSLPLKRVSMVKGANMSVESTNWLLRTKNADALFHVHRGW